ncbi:MAG: type II toxin-antitoxin system VapB family antitoxin [Nakamurella sp.]
MNIKNPHVYELAHELAEATGESMTSVIEVALQQMLERVRAREQSDRVSRSAEIDAIVARTSPLLADLPEDPTADLYDDKTRLPR